MNSPSDRRPLSTRNKSWVIRFTRDLLRTGITPNQVSLLSVAFGIGGAASFLWSSEFPALFLAAAIAIQLRLLANMMDGLLAMEGGLATPNGALFNEVPDRFTDVLFLATAGYATNHPWGILLGWACACGALMTAYIRLHGASANGGVHDFRGPCSKPQRMFLLTVSAILTFIFENTAVLLVGLTVIALGTYITFFRRMKRLSDQLQQHA